MGKYSYLPADYLKNGYFHSDAKCVKKIRNDLLGETAMMIVKRLMESKKNKKGELNNHQLRKFFDHCRSIETKLRLCGKESEAEKYEFIETDVKKLAVYAKYAARVTHGREKIPDVFIEFISANVETIKCTDDFKAFMDHFEAAVAFYAYENPRAFK